MLFKDILIFIVKVKGLNFTIDELQGDEDE